VSDAGTAERLPVLSLPKGPWQPESDGIGYLVTTGMLLRRVLLEEGQSVELLAKGDVLLPLHEESASFSRAEWEVVEEAELAELDLSPDGDIARRPGACATLLSRAIDRSRRIALQAAIMSIVGTDERLHALLWAFAERWGQPAPEGASVEVAVPQEVLGELIGARRPTVNLALSGLRERGLLSESGSGVWTLHGEPPRLPEPATSGAEFDR
jgi:Crp-like helix-turn-helix domain